MARRTKAEAEQTREVIIDAAERLFADKGIAASSLDDIARIAGVTRGAIYWHFEGKPALFQAMMQRVKLPLDQMLEQALTAAHPLASLEALCVYALKYMARDKRVQRVFSTILFGCENGDMACVAMMQKQKREEALAKFEQVFKLARKKGELAAGITPATAALALHSYLSGLFTDYLRYPEKHPLERKAGALMRSYFAGLTA